MGVVGSIFMGKTLLDSGLIRKNLLASGTTYNVTTSLPVHSSGTGDVEVAGNITVTGTVDGVDISTDIIPYTGATANVDLGYYNLTADTLYLEDNQTTRLHSQWTNNNWLNASWVELEAKGGYGDGLILAGTKTLGKIKFNKNNAFTTESRTWDSNISFVTVNEGSEVEKVSISKDGILDVDRMTGSTVTLDNSFQVDAASGSYYSIDGAYSEVKGVGENVIIDFWNDGSGDVAFGLRSSDDMFMVGTDYQLVSNSGLNMNTSYEWGIGQLPETGYKLAVTGDIDIEGDLVITGTVDGVDISTELVSYSGATGDISMEANDVTNIGQLIFNSGAVQVGSSSSATGFYPQALGNFSTASDDYATAVGGWANASGKFSLALGGGFQNIDRGSAASGEGAVSIGMETTSSGTSSIAIGGGNLTEAIREGAEATATKSIAIGFNTLASAENAIAIGTETTNAVANTLKVGGDMTDVFFDTDLAISGDLDISGGLYESQRTISASASATSTDIYVWLNGASSGVTYTLPTPTAGRVLHISCIDSSYPVQVSRNSTETIDGSTLSKVLTQWNSISLISDGTNWVSF